MPDEENPEALIRFLQLGSVPAPQTTVYSLLSGLLAAETLVPALRRDQLGASSLIAYERRWKARLDPHRRISSYLRRLYIKLGDEEIRCCASVGPPAR